MKKLSGIGTIKVVVLVFVFFGMSIQASMLRGNFYSVYHEGTWKSYDRLVRGAIRSRPNLRVVAATIGYGIEGFYRVIRSIVFLHAERSPLYSGSPFPPKAGNREWVADGPMVPIATYLTFGLVTLSPLLFLTLCWYGAFWQRLIVLVLGMEVITGWHPTIATLFFNTASLFADWPYAYYHFAQNLQAYDFAAIGAVLLMALYISRHREKRPWEIVLITVLAQLTIEHLGMVFGIGLGIAAILDERQDRWGVGLRLAARRLVLTGGTVIIVLILTTILFFATGNTVKLGVQEYIQNTPEFIENNFDWIRSNIAQIITLCGIPLIGGAVFGGAIGIWSGAVDDPVVRKQDLNAAFGLAVGFFFAFILGLFTLEYPAEMGRQFLPMSLLSALVGIRGAEILAERTKTIWASGRS